MRPELAAAREGCSSYRAGACSSYRSLLLPRMPADTYACYDVCLLCTELVAATAASVAATSSSAHSRDGEGRVARDAEEHVAVLHAIRCCCTYMLYAAAVARGYTRL